MLPMMPSCFVPASRNGHSMEQTCSPSDCATANERDNFFKIEHILSSRTALDSSRRLAKQVDSCNQSPGSFADKINNKSGGASGVFSVEKIKKNAVTCNLNSDDMARKCSGRRIKVKVSDSDGCIRSISFRNDSSWIKCIQLAKDVYSNNIVVELIAGNQIRLRTVRDIDENEELLLWFTEEISIMMNIPFLTPINIRGNNCYTCHNCKAAFEYPNPLKIHLATQCSQDPISKLWRNFLHSIKSQAAPFNDHPSMHKQTTDIKPQIIVPTSYEHSSSPTNTSLAASQLFFSAHSHLVMKSQSALYPYDRHEHSAFKPVTPPLPHKQQPSPLASAPSPPQHLPLVSAANHLPSMMLLQPHTLPYPSASSVQMHKSSSSSASSPSSSVAAAIHATLFPTTSSPSSSSSIHYSSASNTLFTTSLSSSLGPSSSSSPSQQHNHLHNHHHHQQHHHHRYQHQQLTTTSASAAAAAAALNAAAQIETIVSNMGASKQGHLCIYCGKLYSRKYGLKIHIRTHTGFKPLKCKYCFRPFGDPSNLNKHVRLHMQSGNLSFRCHLCNKTLARRRDLQRHIETRHCAIDDDSTTRFAIA